jgi:hypothetical protein
VKKFLKKFLYVTLLFALAGAAAFISYSYFGGKTETGPRNIGSFVQNFPENAAITTQPYVNEQPEEDIAELRIKATTKVIYEYIYPDNIPVQSEEKFTQLLIGLNREELTEIYYGWDIAEFTEENVILRKKIEEGSERYIIGEKDGFVAVFYDTAQKRGNVKEITKASVSSFSPDEQIRLSEGIYVTGRNNLARILEDYGS